MAPAKRELFVLSEIFDLSGPEIALCLDLNIDCVYTRIRSVRQEFEKTARRIARNDAWRPRRLARGTEPSDVAPRKSDKKRIRQLLLPFIPIGAREAGAASAASSALWSGKSAALLSATIGAGALILFAVHPGGDSAEASPNPPRAALARQAEATPVSALPTAANLPTAAPAEPLAIALPGAPSALPEKAKSSRHPGARKRNHARSEPAMAPASIEVEPEPVEPERVEPEQVEPEPEAERAALPSIAEELRLVRRARAALFGGDLKRGLAELRLYRARYPEGQLRREAAALHILYLCRSGQTAAARRSASTFARTWSDSALDAAVVRGCPDLSEKKTQNSQ